MAKLVIVIVRALDEAEHKIEDPKVPSPTTVQEVV